jgi:putative flippase GtrA
VRYFAVGATAAIVDIATYYVLAIELSIYYLIAGAISFVIATFVNYVLSICYVFSSGVRFRRDHEILAVFIVSAIGLAVHQMVLFACVDLLAFHLMLGKICASGSTFLWNYGARSRYVFAPARR